MKILKSSSKGKAPFIRLTPLVSLSFIKLIHLMLKGNYFNEGRKKMRGNQLQGFAKKALQEYFDLYFHLRLHSSFDTQYHVEHPKSKYSEHFNCKKQMALISKFDLVSSYPYNQGQLPFCLVHTLHCIQQSPRSLN